VAQSGRSPLFGKDRQRPRPQTRTGRGAVALPCARSQGLTQGIGSVPAVPGGCALGRSCSRCPGVPWSGIRTNRPGSGRLSNAARVSGRVSRSRAFGRVPGPAPAVEIENAPLGTVSTHETRGASKPQTQPTTGRTLNIADLLAGVTLFFQRCRRARPGALPLALEPDAAGLGSGKVPGPAPVGFAIGWQRVSHAKRPACPRSRMLANR